MRLALDTNTYTKLCAGDFDVARLVKEAEIVFLPFVVLAELRAGFRGGSRSRQNEGVLQRFLMKPGVEPLLATENTTRMYAALYRQLRQQGTPIPTNDLWIAALVAEHNLWFCSRDAHFKHLPQLNLL